MAESLTKEQARALENVRIRFKYQFEPILRSQYENLLEKEKILTTNIKLGEGAFGVAYKAYKRTTTATGEKIQREIVIKHIPEEGIKNEVSIIKELLITDKVDHEFLVNTFRCVGPVIEDSQIQSRAVQKGDTVGGFYLIQEFLHGGTLNNYFESIALVWDLEEQLAAKKKLIKGQVPLEQVRTWTRQILQAFYYLHTNGICHRDMHKANIMFDATGRVKIIDFGQSERFKTMRQRPEQDLGERRGSTDSFSSFLGSSFDASFYTPDELTSTDSEDESPGTARGRVTTSEMMAQMMAGRGRGRGPSKPAATSDTLEKGSLASPRKAGSPYKETWKVDLYGFNDDMYRLTDIFAYMLHVQLSDVVGGRLIVTKDLSSEREAELDPVLAFGTILYRASNAQREDEIGDIILRFPLSHRWLNEDDILELWQSQQ